jgi:hypothetical protein
MHRTICRAQTLIPVSSLADVLHKYNVLSYVPLHEQWANLVASKCCLVAVAYMLASSKYWWNSFGTADFLLCLLSEGPLE